MAKLAGSTRPEDAESLEELDLILNEFSAEELAETIGRLDAEIKYNTQMNDVVKAVGERVGSTKPNT